MLSASALLVKRLCFAQVAWGALITVAASRSRRTASAGAALPAVLLATTVKTTADMAVAVTDNKMAIDLA